MNGLLIRKGRLWLEGMASKIKSNFISMDVARKDSGELIIMELGDGQVSGLQQIDPQHFYCGFSQNISIPIEELMNELDNKIMNQAEAEGLLDERKSNSGTVKQLERFMDKYGYRNGSGWWVKNKEILFEMDIWFYREVLCNDSW